MRVVSLISLLFIICQSAVAQQTETIQYKGNTIDRILYRDTSIAVDPQTGREKTVLRERIFYSKINGRKIYVFYNDGENANTRLVENTQDELRSYFIKKLTPSIQTLKDGAYTISIPDIIINEQGKIAYHTTEYSTIRKSQYEDKNTPDITFNFNSSLDKEIEKLINNAPVAKTVQADGMIYPYIFDIEIHVTVKNHKVII
ncbi:MAG: hypothetical protein JST82_09175 [Bacteroidetes bacterium]|nr:hypothetical protein [Bacteroidota bacterium]